MKKKESCLQCPTNKRNHGWPVGLVFHWSVLADRWHQNRLLPEICMNPIRTCVPEKKKKNKWKRNPLQKHLVEIMQVTIRDYGHVSTWSFGITYQMKPKFLRINFVTIIVSGFSQENVKLKVSNKSNPFLLSWYLPAQS